MNGINNMLKSSWLKPVRQKERRDNVVGNVVTVGVTIELDIRINRYINK
jgi:hypothetical protein